MYRAVGLLTTSSVRLALRAATLLPVLLPLGGFAQSPGFLVISTPRNAKISYVQLPDDGNFNGVRPKTLIDEGLHHPQGVAVDPRRKRLFVADPDVEKIYGYTFRVHGDSVSLSGQQSVVSDTAESRWVAVDGVGNVFFSDEPKNLILKVPIERMLRGDKKAEVVYDGRTLPQVSQPGGIAVDNFHVFWTNKRIGTQEGALVRGWETPLGTGPGSVSVLASNTAKSYGVCLALGNVYFTDAERFLYGVKKSGGHIAQVSGQLKNPRGCVWDGDGTVYVADKGSNAVYSFAGNMHNLAHAELAKAFEYEDAFGLALISAAPRLLRGLWQRAVLSVSVVAAVAAAVPL